jgi:hypothetical protein
MNNYLLSSYMWMMVEMLDLLEVISALGKSFKVKNMGEMENFAGFKIIDTVDKEGVWIHQPEIIKNLKENFKSIIGETTSIFKKPSAPKTLIIRPKEGVPLISPEKKKNFRMGVGMLLYLVKHSRPDITNSVQELLKVDDGATEAHFKALFSTVKYVMDTGNLGLLLQPRLNQDG